jgi:hypothetical protein
MGINAVNPIVKSFLGMDFDTPPNQNVVNEGSLTIHHVIPIHIPLISDSYPCPPVN